MPLRFAGHGGQQADILSEEAEYQFGQEKGDARRLGVPIAHVVRNQLEGVGRFFCHLLAIAARVQAFWRVEEGAQPSPFLGTAGDFAMAEAVNALFGIGEVGMDFPVVDIGDDQKRRVVQIFAVLQQLLVSGVQVFVRRLVFDGEVVLKEDIGAPVATGFLQRLLEDEDFAAFGLAIAAGHLDADQTAEVKKMRLRDLGFVEYGVRPSVDEYLRRHSV